MHCPNCGGANPDGKKFCGDCGASLTLVCPACSSRNPPEKKFCGDCGTSLTADTPAPQEPKPTTSRAERRQLTVMFCDLVGSTELAARLDPEDMRDVIHTYQNTFAGEITRFEGHVAKFMGDGALAYFGWPKAHEDEAERAVHAGLAVVEAVSRLNPSSDGALSCRVGIATGLVVVGDLVGEGAAQEEAVTGETPNLAARLQELAPPNGVLIAQSTQHLLGGLFDLRDLGVQRLKGFNEPVQAWQVIAESMTEGRFEALRGRHLTPLVGREHEIGLLLDRWERAKEGEGQVVLLSGEPGIGKSRIVRALRERLEDQPHMPLSHYCSPHHVNSALHPVIGLLERAAGFERDDRPNSKLSKLEALLALGTDRLDEAVPLVAALLGMPVGEKYPSLNLTPQRQKQRTLEVLVDQVAGLAAKEPVLAMYEDVHWIDPTTLEVLGLLIERVQQLPVLVLVTYRPEFSPSWSSHAHVMQLSLTRLTRGHGAAIVERITGGKALPAEVLAQILARTDGVPLFVEELTKAVLESGLLADAGDHYELSGALPPMAIPATLHDSLMARLDRLAPVKEVAQIGAVIGREFSHELLAAVAERSDDGLASALDQLVSSGLVFRRGTPPQATYSFKHALVQDAAYQSLLKAKRRQLHARIADILENGFPEIASSQPELLAYHCGQAGLSEKAIHYWLKAARTASDRSSNLEGVAHIAQGLEQLTVIGGAAQRRRLELELRTTLGGLLLITKGHAASEVGETYSRVLELSEQLKDNQNKVLALLGLARFHIVRGQFDTYQDCAQQVLTVAQETNDLASLITGHYILGSGSLQRGDLSAAYQHFAEGAGLHVNARATMSTDVVHHPGIACVARLAASLWLLGYPDQALTKAQEAVSLARELDHPYTLAFVLITLAKLRHFRREARLAQEVAEEAVGVARERGFPYWLPIAEAVQAWAMAASQGMQGATQIRQAVVDREAIGAEFDKTYLLCLLADVLASNGQDEEALHTVTKALAVAKRLGERMWEAELMRRKGESLASLQTGRAAEIEACFLRAIETASAQGSKSLELRAATSLARLWAEQGERRKAHDLLAPVYGWFTEGFGTADLKDVKALLDELA